jgi:hypothetical protein
MHPTGNSMDVIHQLESLSQTFPAGDAWRYAADTVPTLKQSNFASIEWLSTWVDNASGGLNVRES